ncbi:MAG: hypothetical protein C4576_34140 [Desulfobacteraceae bacterium]|nr:MAG: hypothetical protein C4576_34140 [Desulfobacteraceae bacterium]
MVNLIDLETMAVKVERQKDPGCKMQDPGCRMRTEVGDQPLAAVAKRPLFTLRYLRVNAWHGVGV